MLYHFRFYILLILLLWVKGSWSQTEGSQIFEKKFIIPFATKVENPENSCRQNTLSPAEEGCQFIRNKSWTFSEPFVSEESFFKLQNKFPTKQEFYSKYGLVGASEPQLRSLNKDLPMGFSRNPKTKNISINCFLCHGSQINGKPYEGASNQNLDLQTLSEDLGTETVNKFIYAKLMGGKFGFKKHPGMTAAGDLARTAIAMRSQDTGDVNRLKLSKRVIDNIFETGDYKHTPTATPPWWNSSAGLRKTQFLDGGATLTPGHAMIFAMLSQLDGNDLKEIVPNGEKVISCIRSIKVPPSPLPTDPILVQLGEQIYSGNRFKTKGCNCEKCHGLTEPSRPWNYPEKKVPVEVVKTDDAYYKSFGKSFKDQATQIAKVFDPTSKNLVSEKNYIVAPPLVALFTKNALLHNKSVPTLQNLLCKKAEDRPKVWSSYDSSNVFDKTTTSRHLASVNSDVDTSDYGFSNKGHEFCVSELSKDALSCDALIEYLKTLGR